MAEMQSITVPKDPSLENAESDTRNTVRAPSELATSATQKADSVDLQVDKYPDPIDNVPAAGMLATGGRVIQRFADSKVHAVARDQYHIRQVTNLFVTSPNIDIQNIQENVKIEGSSENEETLRYLKNISGQFGSIKTDQSKKSSVPQITDQDYFKNAPEGAGWQTLTDTLRYNKSERLNKGGNVFLGKQYLTQAGWCEVAIKFIYFTQITEESYKEVAFLRKLGHHPNVITVHDAQVKNDGPMPYIYISMPRCLKTLNDVINENKHKPLNFDECILYAEQIVNGVAFIHSKKVQHRDIKPENILIPCEGHCLISDFGLSKEIWDGQATVVISKQTVGTKGYQAPEIHEIPPKYSYRSDSFSIGVVLSVLFSCGAHPYGPDPEDRRSKIKSKQLPDLSSVEESVQPYPMKKKQLVGLIKKLLSHESKNRPLPKDMLLDPFFKDSQLNHSEGDQGGIHSESMQSDCCQDPPDNIPGWQNTAMKADPTGANVSAAETPRQVLKESGQSLDKAQPIRDEQVSEEAQQQHHESVVEHRSDDNSQEDMSLFKNEHDINELKTMKITPGDLHRALASSKYLKGMCDEFVSKISTSDLKEFLRKCGLVTDEVTVNDIEKENNEEKEKRRKLLILMRNRHGAALTPRILMRKALFYFPGMQKVYDDLCECFIECFKKKSMTP